MPHSPTDSPFATLVLRDVFEATPAPEGETDADREARRESVLTAWHAFEPRDTMEQMLATQIVACFFAALDCQRRAVAEGSTVTAIRLYAQTTGMHRAMRQAVQRANDSASRSELLAKSEQTTAAEADARDRMVAATDTATR